MALRARAMEVLLLLLQAYPNARCALDSSDPFQLLVAVVLSAQCTDVAVNKATPALFARWATPATLAAATPAQVEPFIRSLGLFRTKARSLVMLSHQLMVRHGGQVPRDQAALQALAGVGRKTANVVASNAFGVPALAVDTHVARVSRRLGLANADTPDGVEAQLCALWPARAWLPAHHALITHGRGVCSARAPQCGRCALLAACQRRGVR